MMDAIRLSNPNALAETLMRDAETVVERARRGDEEAFRLIFEQHHRLVIKFIYGMVGNLTLAEELAQETFISAYRSLNTYREEGKLAPWLCGIAKNVVRNSLRARRNEKLNEEFDDGVTTEIKDCASREPEAQLLGKELREVVRVALKSLDEDKRLVFTLKLLRQLNYDEIAEITGSSIPKLKTDLHRAKIEMRRLICPYLERNNEM